MIRLPIREFYIIEIGFIIKFDESENVGPLENRVEIRTTGPLKTE